MWKRKKNKAQASFEETARILRGFQFAIWSNGELEITPAGPTLGYQELEVLVGRLLAHRDKAKLTKITFNFEAVEKIESPWTAVFCLLIDLARRYGAACKLTSLRGEPAQMAMLYRRNPPLAS